MWQLIDADPDFSFPDHAGEAITVQDCWIARDRPEVQACVRSLLRKMGYTVLEAPGNGADCTFCANGIRRGGKTPRHLIELLFG